MIIFFTQDANNIFQAECGEVYSGTYYAGECLWVLHYATSWTTYSVSVDFCVLVIHEVTSAIVCSGVYRQER
jgi:hypothetical protein